MAGKLHPQGAKNEALQIIAATLLTAETVVVENIPEIRDVINLINLLSDMGVETKNTAQSTWTFKAGNIDLDFLKTEEFRE